MSQKSLPLFLALLLAHAPSCKTNNVDQTDDEDMGMGAADLANAAVDICQKQHAEDISPMGGTVAVTLRESSALYGTMLQVPAGSVNGVANLQIGCGNNLALTDEVSAGPSVRLSPDGQSFLKPITLTVPYDPKKVPAGAEVLLVAQSAAQRELIGGSDLTVGVSSVTASITHFSDYQVVAKKRPSGPTQNVDVLVVMDNSPSMSTKQRSFIKNFDKFLRPLEKAGMNYQLGVVTSDIGSTVAAGSPWGGSIGSCDTFEGDDGELQTLPCTARSNGTSEARNTCASFCANDRFVPTDGKHFISNRGGVTNVPADMIFDPMTGMMIDNGPVRAFQCLGLVGDGGCGIESPLESARRALDGHRAENSGFLRKDSLLAVIFLTDEDDCSVQMSRRSENNPATRDCADPDQTASYDCYNVDYRCLARSLVCDQPMNVTGIKTNCRERSTSYLEPVSRYSSFLRSLRPESRLMVGGIWTLPSVKDGGKLMISRGSGGMASPYLNRAGGADASCAYASDLSIYGQAQLRLSAFASGITGAKQYSVCDVDHIDVVLGELAQQIIDKAKK